MRTDNALNDFLTAKYRKHPSAAEPASVEVVAESVFDALRYVESSDLKVGTVVRIRLPECRFRDTFMLA